MLSCQRYCQGYYTSYPWILQKLKPPLLNKITKHTWHWSKTEITWKDKLFRFTFVKYLKIYFDKLLGWLTPAYKLRVKLVKTNVILCKIRNFVNKISLKFIYSSLTLVQRGVNRSAMVTKSAFYKGQPLLLMNSVLILILWMEMEYN